MVDVSGDFMNVHEVEQVIAALDVLEKHGHTAAAELAYVWAGLQP